MAFEVNFSISSTVIHRKCLKPDVFRTVPV